MIYIVKFFAKNRLYVYDTTTDKLQETYGVELAKMDFVSGIGKVNGKMRYTRYWYAEDKRILKLAMVSGIKLYTYGGRLYHVECEKSDSAIIRVSRYCSALSDELYSPMTIYLELDDGVGMPEKFHHVENMVFNLDKVTIAEIAHKVYSFIIEWYNPERLDVFIQDSNRERFNLYTAILEFYRTGRISREYEDGFLEVFKKDFEDLYNISSIEKLGYSGNLSENVFYSYATRVYDGCLIRRGGRF